MFTNWLRISYADIIVIFVSWSFCFFLQPHTTSYEDTSAQTVTSGEQGKQHQYSIQCRSYCCLFVASFPILNRRQLGYVSGKHLNRDFSSYEYNTNAISSKQLTMCFRKSDLSYPCLYVSADDVTGNGPNYSHAIFYLCTIVASYVGLLTVFSLLIIWSFCHVTSLMKAQLLSSTFAHAWTFVLSHLL